LNVQVSAGFRAQQRASTRWAAASFVTILLRVESSREQRDRAKGDEKEEAFHPTMMSACALGRELDVVNHCRGVLAR